MIAGVSPILAGRSLAALSFRVAHQLYAALQPRLGRIREAAVNPEEEDVPELIQLISQKCLDEMVIPKQHLPETFLEEARRAFTGIIHKLRVQEKSRLVIPILEEVESELAQPLSPEACALTMQELCAKGWGHLGKLIESWGGPLAQARLKQCCEARTVFGINNRSDRPELTYPSTQRDRNEIIWNLGHRAPRIEAFLGYDFYFLHEYLSHLFHTGDHVDPTLAETHLLPAALLFLEQRPDLAAGPSLLDTLFLVSDFDALRKPEPRYFHIEKKFRELFEYAGAPFLTFLLEWTTQSPDPSEGKKEYDLVLRGLYGLKDPQTAQTLIWGAAQPGAEWKPDSLVFSKTYERLRANAALQDEAITKRLSALASKKD